MFVSFSDFLRKKLREPIGTLTSVDGLKTDRKIIAVGDQITLNLVDAGNIPHLSVCDFRIKRKEIGERQKLKIKKTFRIAGKCRNPPGTLSKYILKNAKKYLKSGGLLIIEGEEDLTALAFILSANKNYLVLYGQPDRGVVVVKPERVKEKVRKILGSALGHEVK